MRTITIPIDLDTALALLEPNETLIELVATGPGVGITIGAVRLVEEVAKIADPPPAPSPTLRPITKKAPAAKPAVAQASNVGHTCSTCGRVFKTAQAKGVHQTRVHGRSTPAPVKAVPPLPPTPIAEAPPAPGAQSAPTRPSSMCDRGDHTMCKTTQARCNCSCHGPHGQQPPVGRAS